MRKKPARGSLPPPAAKAELAKARKELGMDTSAKAVRTAETYDVLDVEPRMTKRPTAKAQPYIQVERELAKQVRDRQVAAGRRGPAAGKSRRKKVP